jgi:hypothetical protein
MSRLVFITAEWTLIVLIGLCGTLAFAQSGIYSALHDFVLARYPDIGHYLIWIIWSFLALIGIFSITFRRKGGGGFTWFALIFASPSILAFNKFDILSLLGLNFKITTALSFWQVLLLTTTIITAYLLLNFLRELKIFRLSLIKKAVDPADIENVSVKSHKILLLISLCSLFLSACVILIAVNLKSWIMPVLIQLPWNIGFIGIGCLFILAVYIYWLGTHTSSPEK